MGGQKKGKRRLQPEAYAILNDYFVNVSKWPDSAAQEDLAERVRQVEDCEFYTARQVYSYFANNRAKIRYVGSDAALPTGDSARRGRRKAPDSVIQKLNVLLNDEPDPSPEVVEVWAESLGSGVVAQHILTYAFLRRATTRGEAETQAESPKQGHRAETSAARQEAGSQVSSLSPASLDASTQPSPPHCSPHHEKTEHPAPLTFVPPPPTSANNNNKQLADVSAAPRRPAYQPPLLLEPDISPARNDNAARARVSPVKAIPPHAAASTTGNTARSDDLVQRVRAALLAAPRDSPKTFVDFARWLEAHNEGRRAGVVLHAATASVSASAGATARALQRA
ncbi:transcription factor [Ganoderma sinense ZZ0214-1]|uniref:Transcription factor n=1 Tax=Ganoderma sinense ZZ0214-1 TaxID=1077348 RepID=A0A2G8S2D6_9APHY|nr:transcription factor [Ganoderma sinense ZZ0214-1]